MEVSAWTSQGIETLLETLSLTSEILELKADPTRPAYGVVLEAEASTGRGVVVTLLVREGTLHLGDYVLCGPAHGRVRGMWLNGITTVEEAGPSTPVKVTGLNIVPEAGEKLYVFEDVQQARNLADSTLRKKRELDRADRQQITLENLFSTIKKGTVPEVRLILKADVRGSIEALRNSLETLSTEEVKIKILHSGVGAINQDDVGLAHASSAIVIGFNVTADERARELAEELDPGTRLGPQSRPTEMDKRPRFKRDTIAKGQVTRRFQLGFFYEDIEVCRFQHAGQQEVLICAVDVTQRPRMPAEPIETERVR